MVGSYPDYVRTFYNIESSCTVKVLEKHEIYDPPGLYPLGWEKEGLSTANSGSTQGN